MRRNVCGPAALSHGKPRCRAPALASSPGWAIGRGIEHAPKGTFAAYLNQISVGEIERLRLGKKLERSPLLADVFHAVLPAGHRLARRKRPLDLSDLAGESWIGGAPASAWYRIACDACRRAGFTPRPDFASDDHIAVQALVAAGLGVSVIPGLAVTHPLPGLEVRELRSGAPVRHISAARPRDGYNGPAVGAMIDSLRAAARRLAATPDRS